MIHNSIWRCEAFASLTGSSRTAIFGVIAVADGAGPPDVCVIKLSDARYTSVAAARPAARM